MLLNLIDYTDVKLHTCARLFRYIAYQEFTKATPVSI